MTTATLTDLRCRVCGSEEGNIVEKYGTDAKRGTGEYGVSDIVTARVFVCAKSQPGFRNHLTLLDEDKCSQVGTYGIGLCGRPKKAEYEGRNYCGIHDPVAKHRRKVNRALKDDALGTLYYLYNRLADAGMGREAAAVLRARKDILDG